ncbi:hypothetical protein Tco_0938474 [Tanacetum coccineum]|uniref:Uncharacterized protein n=1 Tax=Tanacetum coccineum TaxID=301880 RepID=A0ABQ5DNF4_9ASTR
MNMDESIQVASIIDRLPPTWRDVKKNLKHWKDDMFLKELRKHLLIEEQYCLENKTNNDTSKVHVVEDEGESSKVREKRKHKDDKEKDKFKKNKKDVDSNYVAMISKAFFPDEEQSWWVDSGATRHVCNNKAMFKIYEPPDCNTLTLNNVFHVPNVRKNLMSGSVLKILVSSLSLNLINLSSSRVESSLEKAILAK